VDENCVVNSPENLSLMLKRLAFISIGCLALSCAIISCQNTTTAQQPNPTPQPLPSKQEEPTPSNTPAPAGSKVIVHTAFGDMTVLLYDETPQHRDNFVKLVGQKFYDDLLFHRCIKQFMVQGGDPDSRNAAAGKQLGMGGPGYTIPAEFNAKFIHKKGALCAARMGDAMNPRKESSGSQFYLVQGKPMTDAELTQIETMVATKMPGFKYTAEQKNLYKTVGGTPFLDMDYTVFGEVIEGLSVIESINAQPTARGDRPLKDIKMSMEIVK